MCDENKGDDVIGQQRGRTVSAARQGFQSGGGVASRGVCLSFTRLFFILTSCRQSHAVQRPVCQAHGGEAGQRQQPAGRINTPVRRAVGQRFEETRDSGLCAGLFPRPTSGAPEHTPSRFQSFPFTRASPGGL